MRIRPLTAPELYLKAIGTHPDSGDEECHYCTAPCNRSRLHDDPAPIPFVRNPVTAQRPSSPWMCKGCWTFHLPSITVRFLNGDFKDRKGPQDFSWWITKHETFAIREEDHQKLYEFLLSPPNCFCLSLLDGIGIKNKLHFSIVNDVPKVEANTNLRFTINNIPHAYTIYELEEAIIHGSDGKEPGVRALLNLLGPCKLNHTERKKGRPTKEESPNSHPLYKYLSPEVREKIAKGKSTSSA